MGRRKPTRRGPTPTQRRKPPYVWFLVLGMIFTGELLMVIMIATERMHYLALAMALIKEFMSFFAAFPL